MKHTQEIIREQLSVKPGVPVGKGIKSSEKRKASWRRQQDE
jgi:hypothetical protein